MRKLIDVALPFCLATVSAGLLSAAAKLLQVDEFGQGAAFAGMFLVAHAHATAVMAGRA
jgi:hypothetical protein